MRSCVDVSCRTLGLLLLLLVLVSCREGEEPTAPVVEEAPDATRILQWDGDRLPEPEAAQRTSGSCSSGVECIEVIDDESSPESEAFIITMENAGNLVTIDGEVPGTGVTFGNWIAGVSIESGGHLWAVNLPSPVTALTWVNFGSEEPMWREVLIDPPALRVDFDWAAFSSYTVAAYDADSSWVAGALLWANNSGDTATNWSAQTLQSSGNPISRVRWSGGFNTLAIDDLRIVRAVPPTIECDTVVRGNVATCTITEPVDEVVSWRFEGLLSDGSHTVLGNHTGTDWDGMVVAGGDVFAEVVIGGVPQELWGPLDVLPREWRWGEADWDFIDGDTLPPGAPDQEAWADGCSFTEWVVPGLDAGGDTRLGENGRQEGCDLPGHVDPRLQTDTVPEDPLGASYDQVLDGGPNDSIWYVTATHYRMDRRSAINPSLTPDGPTRVLNPQHHKDCDHLGMDPLDIGWYTFNVECKEVPADSLVDAVWLHQGYGLLGLVNPFATGHQARLEWGAETLEGDPFAAVEDLTTPDRPTLHEGVHLEVEGIELELRIWGDQQHQHVRNNGWCDEFWLYVTDEWQGGGPKNRYQSFQFLVCP